MNDTVPDEVLIARIAARDQTAMKALYLRHQTRTYRFLRRLVKSAELAEDLTGDVFLDVWRQAGQYEARSSVSTWLLSIARFKALSSFRRKAPETFDPETAEEIADESDTPEISLQKVSKAKALRLCIERLSRDTETDELGLRRLKKRKLRLKDMIAYIENKLIPDLDA